MKMKSSKLCFTFVEILSLSLAFHLLIWLQNVGADLNNGNSESDDMNVQHNKQKYFTDERPRQHPCLSDSEHGSCKQEVCKWGYEKDCTNKKRYSQSKTICKEVESHRSFRSMDERTDAFWNENDFGYVNNVNKLHYMCEPKSDRHSSFSCNSQLTYCKGRYIFMDFRWNGRLSHERSRNKAFDAGQFGGFCKYHSGRFSDPSVYRGGLMSWAERIDGFQSIKFKPSVKKNCDVTVTTPTIIMDLDFPGNLYHHFCDFFNLYISLHVNGSFSKDVDIATWDTRPSGRLGPFSETWKAFTNRKVYSLWNEFEGKKVCFDDVVFSLLPRMAHGMYYSTPVVPGCSKSGLFHAFSKHILSNLNITQNRKSKDEPLRITLLSRSTQWRRIVNENELATLMRALPNVQLKVVNFNKDIPFLEQLKISHNTEIFIGMHGAGLAHTLFLPDWALLFEIYNTEDLHCYKDLARLRGVSYLTWQDRSKLKDETENPHPQHTYEKFRNYRFDLKEFNRLLGIALNQVAKNLQEIVTIQ